MRISDWSSAVGSSDRDAEREAGKLGRLEPVVKAQPVDRQIGKTGPRAQLVPDHRGQHRAARLLLAKARRRVDRPVREAQMHVVADQRNETRMQTKWFVSGKRWSGRGGCGGRRA